MTQLDLAAGTPEEARGRTVPLPPEDEAWAAAGGAARRNGRLTSLWKDLRSPSVAIPGVVLVLIVLACFAGPAVLGLPAPTAGSLSRTMLPLGSPGHLLGTNELGNDVLSRLLNGGRVSLVVGIGATAISLVVGALLGMTAGFFGGWYEKVVMRLFDTLLAFPSLILAMALADYLGPSLGNTIFAISVFGVSKFGRLAWAQTLAVRRRDFVVAPRADGASARGIILGHVVPNVAPSLLGIALFSVGTAMMIEAGLSYLGLGVPQPQPTWGNLISTGQQFLNNAPRLVILPCLALLVTVLSLNLMADALQARRGENR